MVTALKNEQTTFEQAFVVVKQEQETEVSDQPNPKLVAFSERIDLIFVRDVDKVIEYLTRELPMDLDPFFNFFQWSFSLQKTAYTVSLAQFVAIYIEFIEVTFRERKEGNRKKPFLRASESMTAETLNQYIFGENFIEQQDLINEKIQLHNDRIRRVFAQVDPANPNEIPLGRLKEIWLQITLITHCVMVKAGTEYKLGQRLLDDPECLTQLHEHVCLAHFIATRQLPTSEFKTIIRAEEGQWPRDFIRTSLENRDSRAAVRPKLIKFADEAAFIPDSNVFDEQKVSADFILYQIEDFFQTRRSIVLVDLDKLQQGPPRDEEAKEVELVQELEKIIEPEIKKKQPVLSYVEEDPYYVPPPSSVTPEEQKIIDKNLLEVFNLYCRKYANQKGDFNQISENLVVLGLQGYTKFCKDFKIPATNNELTTVWKKSSTNHQPHEFDQYQKSITLLGVTINKSKVEKYQQR